MARQSLRGTITQLHGFGLNDYEILEIAKTFNPKMTIEKISNTRSHIKLEELPYEILKYYEWNSAIRHFPCNEKVKFHTRPAFCSKCKKEFPVALIREVKQYGYAIIKKGAEEE